MRILKTHNMAASMTPLPFDGLGFAMETVSCAAEGMHITHLTGMALVLVPSGVETVVQPSGYSLLVALGREIRGR